MTVAPLEEGREEVWAHFSEEQLAGYTRSCDVVGLEASTSVLSEVLGIEDWRFTARDAVRLDYAVYMLQFARQQKYGPTRTASLFCVSQRVLAACTSGSPMAAAEATLKADLVARCRAHPDDDSAYFSSEQVARIGSFFVSLLFHNYRLYQHAFTEEQGLTECAAQLLVETPIIPSFEGAMPEEEWHAQQAAAAAASEAKRVAAEEEAATTAAEKRAEAEALTKAETDATRAAELARKPATLEEAVAQMVGLRLQAEKVALSESYKKQEAALMEKIDALQAKQPVKK